MAVVRKMEDFEPRMEAQSREARRPEPEITSAQVMAVVNAALNIVGARLLLLVGLIGAIGIAYLALQSTSSVALWAQGIFTLTVFGPLVWLSAKRAV